MFKIKAIIIIITIIISLNEDLINVFKKSYCNSKLILILVFLALTSIRSGLACLGALLYVLL